MPPEAGVHQQRGLEGRLTGRAHRWLTEESRGCMGSGLKGKVGLQGTHELKVRWG